MEIVKEESQTGLNLEEEINPTINLIVGIVPGRTCSYAQSQIDNENLTISTDHLFALMELLANIRKYKGQYMIYLYKKGGYLTSKYLYYQLVQDYLIQYEMPYKEVKKIPLMNEKQFKALTGIQAKIKQEEFEAAHLVLGKRG